MNDEVIKDNVAPEEPQPSEETTQDKAAKGKQDKVDRKLAKQVAELQEKLEAKEKEMAEANDKFVRLAAEYDNYRRRSTKEKETMFGDGKADAIERILPVLDNLDRAMAVVPETEEAKKYHEGVKMVIRQFKEVLAKAGVAEIEAVGQPFNPNIHNAVMHVEDDSVGENVVVEEFQKGYMLGDRVIRHSMVKVAN